MLEFGQDIRWVALVIMGIIANLHPGGKLMLPPVRAPTPKYPVRLFSSETKSNILDVMLEFGQDIRWVSLVIMGIISNLHPGGKLMLPPMRAPTAKYPVRLFSSETKSNIDM